MPALLGVAHVGPDYGPRTLVGDADGIADEGFHAIKLHLSPNYATEYPLQSWGGSHASLTELAQDAACSTVFGDSRLTTFALNVWTFANGTNNPWTNGVEPNSAGVFPPSANLAAERAEIKALATHLLQTYSGKTFILQQSEADWALLGQASDAARQFSIPSYRSHQAAAFFRERQGAIEEARHDVTSSSRVLHGLEMNLVLDDNGPRFHRDVLPYCRPDIVSFSAYESIITAILSGVPATAEAEIDRRLRAAWSHVQSICPGVATYIGEFGWPENESWFTSLVSGGLSVAGIVDRVVDTADALGMEACIMWTYRDNEEQSPGVPRGFYVRKPDGNLSAQGSALIARLPP